MPINIDGSKGIRQNTTEVTKIPVGTTAQRPANPEAGMIRFNTDERQVETYNPIKEEWQSISESFSVQATGGTVTDIEQDGQLFRVHTFTSDGAFEVTRGGEVEYLVAAGGGSGGRTHTGISRVAGGGGAGGLIHNVGGQALQVTPQTYPITVGAGGAGTTGTDQNGNNGEDSTAFELTALGGGGGAHGGDTVFDAHDGGSGGGAARSDSVPGTGLQPLSADGGFGNDGGDPAGGGGGARGKGGDGPGGGVGGEGGLPLALSITGTLQEYAGGGGGGGSGGNFQDSNGGGSVGGNGGAGNVQGDPPVANTGSGSGGQGTNSNTSQNSHPGSDGIVIVRYRIG